MVKTPETTQREKILIHQISPSRGCGQWLNNCGTKNHLPLSTLYGRDPYNNYASGIWKLLTPLASI